MTALVSDLPVAALKGRLGLPEREAGNLVETLGRLGIGALGELAALSPRLEELPAPAVSLSLRADGLGPPGAEGASCSAAGGPRPAARSDSETAGAGSSSSRGESAASSPRAPIPSRPSVSTRLPASRSGNPSRPFRAATGRSETRAVIRTYVRIRPDEDQPTKGFSQPAQSWVTTMPAKPAISVAIVPPAICSIVRCSASKRALRPLISDFTSDLNARSSASTPSKRQLLPRT